MKKTLAMLSVLAIAFPAAAQARTYTGPDAARHERRQAMIEERRARGEESSRTAPAAKAEGEGFWAREAKRSGVSEWKPGNFIRNLNPAPFFKEQKERYEARKAQANAG